MSGPRGLAPAAVAALLAPVAYGHCALTVRDVLDTLRVLRRRVAGGP